MSVQNAGRSFVNDFTAPAQLTIALFPPPVHRKFPVDGLEPHQTSERYLLGIPNFPSRRLFRFIFAVPDCAGGRNLPLAEEDKPG
jgi:hypothetical protein